MHTGTTGQIILDEHSNAMEVYGNLQFNYETFTNGRYHTKERNLNVNPPNELTFFHITPTNGFYAGKFTNVPELCYIKDMTNDNMVKMWDLKDSNKCVDRLKYLPHKGI